MLTADWRSVSRLPSVWMMKDDNLLTGRVVDIPLTEVPAVSTAIHVKGEPNGRKRNNRETDQKIVAVT